MAPQTPRTDSFESQLQDGRRKINIARQDRQVVEEFEQIPDQLVKSIGDCEEVLEKLEGVLRVTEDDISRTNRVLERIEVLTRTFRALRETHESVITGDTRRIERFASGIVELAESSNLQSTRDELSEIENRCEMLNELIESNRSDRIMKITASGGSDQANRSSQLIPRRIDHDVRRQDRKIATKISDSNRAEVYLKIADDLLADVHNILSTIYDKNGAKTEFSDSLKNIKEWLSEGESKLEMGAATSAATAARIGLDGCLATHQLLIREHSDQQTAEALADTIDEFGLEAECDVSSCVKTGDRAALLKEITASMSIAREMDTADEVKRLLEEYDWSVDQMVEATEYDAGTIMNSMTKLYQEGKIDDIPLQGVNS